MSFRVVPFYLFVVVLGLKSCGTTLVASQECNHCFINEFEKSMIKERFALLQKISNESWCTQYQTEKWLIVSEKPICFGARNSMYGTFQLPAEGFIAALKLVHAKGKVTCNKHTLGSYSKWGCSSVKGKDPLNVIVTTQTNRIVFPQERFINDGNSMWYEMPGYDSNSAEVIFQDKIRPLYVTSGQKLRLWYGEDLTGKDEGGNSGKSCAHIFAWYL